MTGSPEPDRPVSRAVAPSFAGTRGSRQGPRRRPRARARRSGRRAPAGAEQNERLPSTRCVDLQDEPAEDQGARHGLAVRPDNPAADRQPPPQRDVDLPVGLAGFQVEPRGKHVHRTVGGPAAPRRWSRSRRTPGARSRRSPGRPGIPVPAARRRDTCRPARSPRGQSLARTCAGRRVRDETHDRPGDGPGRPLLGDLAMDHHAPGQGEVDRLLDRSLGPFALLQGGQVGRTSGDWARTTKRSFAPGRGGARRRTAPRHRPRNGASRPRSGPGGRAVRCRHR